MSPASAAQGPRVGTSPFLANREAAPLQGFALGIAHRGFCAEEGKENTLPAFERAIELGCSYLELDVWVSADAQVIVTHDPTIMTREGERAIRDLTLAELRESSGNSEPLATVDELFDAATLRWPHTRLNIDVKHHDAAVPLAEAIYRHRIHDRVLIASFDDENRQACVQRLREVMIQGQQTLGSRMGHPAPQNVIAQSPGQKTVALFTLLSKLGLGRLARKKMRGCVALQVPLSHRGIPVATKRLLRSAHALGLQVHVWTINDEPTMRRLLDEGFDGIITDRCDLLARILQERGQWPQSR